MALEKLRKEILTQSSAGSNLMIDLGIFSPDFRSTYTDARAFPAELFFNKSDWKNSEYRLRTKREEEIDSLFNLSEQFQLSIRSGVETEAEVR